MVQKLENTKCSGADEILNEYLKHCPPKCIIMITKLFNLILDSGISPEQWSLGIIKPIYKNSGDSNCPSSYRGVKVFELSQ